MIWSFLDRPGAPCSLYSIFFLFFVLFSPASFPPDSRLLLLLTDISFLSHLARPKSIPAFLSLFLRKAFVYFFSFSLSINSGRSPPLTPGSRCTLGRRWTTGFPGENDPANPCPCPHTYTHSSIPATTVQLWAVLLLLSIRVLEYKEGTRGGDCIIAHSGDAWEILFFFFFLFSAVQKGPRSCVCWPPLLPIKTPTYCM
jgi:hypothetical protein